MKSYHKKKSKNKSISNLSYIIDTDTLPKDKQVKNNKTKHNKKPSSVGGWGKGSTRNYLGRSLKIDTRFNWQFFKVSMSSQIEYVPWKHLPTEEWGEKAKISCWQVRPWDSITPVMEWDLLRRMRKNKEPMRTKSKKSHKIVTVNIYNQWNTNTFRRYSHLNK